MIWTKTKWEDERYLRLILNEIGQIVSLDELNTTNKTKEDLLQLHGDQRILQTMILLNFNAKFHPRLYY